MTFGENPYNHTLEAGISLWLRGNTRGKRDYTLHRISVLGLDEILQKWVGDDEYAAVFSEEEIAKEIFDTIFVDVDAHDGEDIGKVTNDFLIRAKVCPSRMYFTGRGCHAYFDLEEPIEGRENYRKFCRSVMEEWGVLDIVDSSVIGDVRRMARLPGSRNRKNGLTMVMIPTEWTDSIYRYSRAGRSMVLEGNGRVSLKSFGLERKNGGKEDVEMRMPVLSCRDIVWEEAEYPPCIRMAGRLLVETGELDHMERIHMAMFLLVIGKEEKLWGLLRRAKDFNESISGYHINYLKERIKNGTMNCLKCSSVPASICPYISQSDCLYFPSINTHLRKRALNTKLL